MLAIFGFACVAAILFLIMSKKMTPLVSLVLVPLIFCILLGKGDFIGDYVKNGVTKVAVNGVMYMFSILFFGLMRDNGAFDPVVKGIVKFMGGNPVLVVIGAYTIALIGHLDGAGATTFLLACPVMMPIFESLKMSNMVLCCVVAMGAGIMNMVPWGGQVNRASVALGLDLMEIYRPLMLPQIMGILSGYGIAFYLGVKEKRRLTAAGLLVEGHFPSEQIGFQSTEFELSLRRPKLYPINLAILLTTIAIMMTGVIIPAATFIVAACLTMLINYRSPELQRKLVSYHAPECMMIAGVLFAAGVMSGILTETGMIGAMSDVLIRAIPESLVRYSALIFGFFAMPLTLIFDTDAFYYGVLPVIANSVGRFGVPPTDIARAFLTGLHTIGFPISAFSAAIWLLISLCKVELGDLQKFAFKWLWLMSLVVLFGCFITGVFVL
ncbi:MAG: citrate:proton symporter [Synergistaceae bacterium]|jgi:CitMHS family citrate-Mg2+:H+ or citrate-Ca2+:H+ symporter|nr:citrate:proton symporter [Synergistaceae bacterium]